MPAVLGGVGIAAASPLRVYNAEVSDPTLTLLLWSRLYYTSEVLPG